MGHTTQTRPIRNSPEILLKLSEKGIPPFSGIATYKYVYVSLKLPVCILGRLDAYISLKLSERKAELRDGEKVVF